MTESRRLFCFGLGYSALVFARELVAEGWRVGGTYRDQAPAVPGIEAVPFDAADRALAGTTHVLLSVPPDADGDPVLRRYGAALRQLGGVVWVGYLSTTGVYGDRAGDWVDENSARTPSGWRSQQRLAAENAWLGSGLPAHVFRLAGIYGPRRSALDQVRAGTARRIDKPGQIFSRIHVADIAQVLRASIDRPNAGAAYNVCDDHPGPPHAVIEEACRLLGRDPPPLEPFEEARKTMTPMALSFYADSKRVRNDRIKQELGVTLRYPSFREGLRAILDA